jgi:hypothetical protein
MIAQLSTCECHATTWARFRANDGKTRDEMQRFQGTTAQYGPFAAHARRAISSRPRVRARQTCETVLHLIRVRDDDAQ